MHCTDRFSTVTRYQLSIILLNNVDRPFVTTFYKYFVHWTQIKWKRQKNEFNCNFPCDTNRINLKNFIRLGYYGEWISQYSVEFYLLIQFICLGKKTGVTLLGHGTFGIFSPMKIVSNEWMQFHVKPVEVLKWQFRKFPEIKMNFMCPKTITHIYSNGTLLYVLTWNRKIQSGPVAVLHT